MVFPPNPFLNFNVAPPPGAAVAQKAPSPWMSGWIQEAHRDGNLYEQQEVSSKLSQNYLTYLRVKTRTLEESTGKEIQFLQHLRTHHASRFRKALVEVVVTSMSSSMGSDSLTVPQDNQIQLLFGLRKQWLQGESIGEYELNLFSKGWIWEGRGIERELVVVNGEEKIKWKGNLRQ